MSTPGVVEEESPAQVGSDDDDGLKIHSKTPLEVVEQYNHNKKGRLKRRKFDTMEPPVMNHKYIFGNYDSYYGYRSLESDGRIKEMEKIKDLLKAKHWLDVGCNNGQLTSLLAEKFEASGVTGIDIDYRLINRAIATHRSKCIEAPCDFATYFPASCSSLVMDAKKSPKMDFRTANIANLRDNIPLPGGDLFDVVLALSVSKWIHLNYDDSGLRVAFSRISALLKTGGLFIFEPQPWKSYRKAVGKLGHELTARNLKIHPSEFGQLLVSQFGFEELHEMTPRETDTFNGRGITVYKKIR